MSIQSIFRNISKNHYKVSAFLLPTKILTDSVINKEIGSLQIYQENNIAIINSHQIIPEFRNNGYGTNLLADSENFISNQLNLSSIQINLWCNDRCYFNYHTYYKNRGFTDSYLDLIPHQDTGDEIKYLIAMQKKSDLKDR
jgi:hypothetical protein